MEQRLVFIPEGVVKKHTTDALEFGLTDCIGEVESLLCPGSCGALSPENLTLLLTRWRIQVIPGERAIVEDLVFEVARRECDTYISMDQKHPAQEKLDAIFGELTKTLETFGSRLGLSEVGLHFMSESKDFFPPRKSAPNSLTLIVGGGPVGLFNSQNTSTLCGIRLTEDGKELSLRSHCGGYGGLVTDDNNIVMAQIVNSVYYLTIPSKHSRFVTHFSDEGTNLFFRLLCMTWNRRNRATPPAKRTVVGSSDVFVKEMLAYEKHGVQAYRTMAETARSRVTQLERDLRLEILNVGNLDRIANNLELHTKSPTRHEKLRASFERLKNHRLIDQIVTTDDEFFEIWTKPVFIEHEGQLRGPLGPFIVTIYRETGILIRCCDYPHMGQYVHPHVPVDIGEPCLGNATRAIGEALGSDDRTTGIELVLEWLESGYDHSIAEVKITNWPVFVPDPKVAKEPIDAN